MTFRYKSGKIIEKKENYRYSEVSMQKKFQVLKENINKIIKNSVDDLVNVYSAQACYFIIVSTIPFLCLVISITSFLIPTDIYAIFDSYEIPVEIKGVIQEVIAQLLATQKVSLLSISALIALWTASRGSDALRAGLESVYEVPRSKKILKQQALSIVNTFILILVILVNVVVLLFGEAITNALHLAYVIDVFVELGPIILFGVMCFVFDVIYTSTAKHSKNEHIRSGIKSHMPGAVFATVGWLVFSYFYALYIRYFPSASAIYGSLTAVCLMMLWLYVCVIILLMGAEVNKLFIMNKENHNI